MVWQPLALLPVDCQILVWLGTVRAHPVEGGRKWKAEPAHPCLWSPTIGGMDGVEEMDAGQPVFVLLQNETLIWDMERRRRKRRRAGRRRSGLQEGVRSFWFKMRFSFIYLFSWAHSSRLSACFLLYVLWPQCPLPPPPAFFCVSNVSGSASANMCVCVCALMHIYTSTTTASVCLTVHVCECCVSKTFFAYLNSVYCYMRLLSLHMCLFVRSESLCWPSRDEWYPLE